MLFKQLKSNEVNIDIYISLEKYDLLNFLENNPWDLKVLDSKEYPSISHIQKKFLDSELRLTNLKCETTEIFKSYGKNSQEYLNKPILEILKEKNCQVSFKHPYIKLIACTRTLEKSAEKIIKYKI